MKLRKEFKTRLNLIKELGEMFPTLPVKCSKSSKMKYRILMSP